MDISGIITKLSTKLSGLDNYKERDGYDAIVLDDHEVSIDDIIIFVSGEIIYTWDTCAGDYPYTPSSSDRVFDSAELEVTIFVDDEDEDGIKLNNEQLQILYENLK